MSLRTTDLEQLRDLAVRTAVAAEQIQSKVGRHRETNIYFKLPKPSKGGGSVWDFAASACLMAECGSPPTDVHGQALSLNPKGSTFMNKGGVVYASCSELREQTIRIILSMT